MAVTNSQTNPAEEFDTQLSPTLTQLSDLLANKEFLLATAQGDGEISKTALNAVKSIFDLGISLEHQSHPHLHPLLTSVIEPPSHSTRSKAAAKKGKKGAIDATDSPEPKDEPVQTAESLLPYTPLDGLYTEGMNFGQIWQQLELRSGKLGQVLKVVGIESPEPRGDESDEGMDSDDDSEGSGSEEDEDLDFEGLSEEEKAEWLGYLEKNPDQFTESYEDDGESGDDEESGSQSGDEEESGSELASDDDGSEIASDDEEGMEEEDELENASDEEMDSMDDEAEGDEEDDDEESASGFQTRRGPQHPTLDDAFFSIDDFNRITEEQEAGKSSFGKLGGGKDDDDDEDDDIRLDDDIGDLLGEDVLEGEEGEADMMYSDFFPPPPRDRSKPPQKKPEAKGRDKNGKKGKASVRFNETDDMEEDTPAAEEAEPAAGPSSIRDTMSRVRDDLFGEDDEAEEKAASANLSSHEKRMLALREQISALEQENIGPKDWTLLGEATSKARPENSLLEENLDFEHTGKVVPLVTEEKVLSLEEMIKKRILDGNFDDVQRRREIDDKAFLPSRYFELQDSQSTRSLAQIYEDEYQAAASGDKAVDPRDAKLSKDHDEIDKLWNDICYKLDALSNLHFTPKAPKSTITTLSNVATASMEDALPTTQSAATMLAPEEMLAPATASQLVARSELDPEQKRHARQKMRKARATQRKALDVAVDKFAGKSGVGGHGRARGGVKGEKDRALQELVKTGKGVTVVGQQPTKKKGSRPTSASAGPSVGLKL